MLTKAEVLNDLTLWAASQKPGEVSPISFAMFDVRLIALSFFLIKVTKSAFHHYTNDVVLSKNGFQKKILYKAATWWMYKMGFRPSLHKKTIYYDGFKQPDVAAAEILQDVSQQKLWNESSSWSWNSWQ